MTTTFKLINRRKIISTIYISKNLNEVIHEYLSLIDTELKLLTSYNINLLKTDLNFDHLFIVEEFNTEQPKIYPLILKIYKFNFMTFNIYYKSKNSFITTDTENYIDDLIDSIKNSVDKLSNKNNVFYKRSTKQSNIKTNNNEKIKLKDFFEETQNTLKNINNINLNKKSVIPDKNNKEDELSLESIETNDNNNVGNNSEISPEKTPFNTVITKVNNYNNNINIDSDDLKNIDADDLKKQIEYLQKLKLEEQNKIDNLKKDQEKELDNFSNFNDKLNDDKRFFLREKERYEERKRKFEADKTVYKRINNDLQEGKIEDVPILFKEEYPLFQFMWEKNLLNIDGDFELYMNLYNSLYDKTNNEDDKPYIPHNINYLCKEEQEKYKDVQEKYKDEIDNFMNNKKTYPSLNDVLEGISEDSSSNESTSDEDHLNIIDGNFDEFDSDNNFEEYSEYEETNNCCNCEESNNEKNELIDTISNKMNSIELNN